MGFGFLLVGYMVTFLMSLNALGWVIRIPGYILMLAGTVKLRDYFPLFRLGTWAAALLGLSDLFDSALNAAALLSRSPVWADAAASVNGWVKFGLELLFHGVLLICVYIAADTVGIPDEKVSAVTDLIAVFVGHAVYVLAAQGHIPTAAAVLIRVVWTVMVTLLLFACYRKICPEGDEDMPVKPSRFGFINRMREITDAREQRAMEDARALMQKRMARRASGGNSRKKRKK